MATRQYIGARYTPKFVGEYDTTQAYEALEVVDNGSGTTYIARKPVPPNTPLTNTTYWLVYGSSSGAILDLQDRVSTIENTDIPGLESDIGDVNTAITGINSSILRMGGEIAQNAEDIEDLRGQFVTASKRVVFVTDSYGTHSETNWAKRTATIWGLSSGNYFILAEGSSGFAHQGQQGHTFKELLDANSGTITDHDTITDIIVGGGTNDFYYLSTFSALTDKMSEFITYCKTAYPNAKITFAFMGYMANMDYAMREKYFLTINAYSSAAIGRDCNFINAFSVMHNYYNRGDAQHPNETGNQLLANFIVNYFNGKGTPSTISESDIVSNLTPPAGGTYTGTPNITERVLDNSAVFIISGVNLNKSVTVTSGTAIEIGRFDATKIPVVPVTLYRPPCFIKTGTTVDYARLQFSVSGNDGIITVVPLIDRGAVTGISLQGMFFTVPLLMA